MNNNTKERSFLLIIGINEYKDLKRLNNAVKDAEDVKSLMLSSFQFTKEHCITLLNEKATNDNIISQLDYLVDTLTEKDSLLIYYAGHGEFKENIDTGYWIPVDAKSDKSGNYISHPIIIRYLKSIKAKHIVLISDSCFSGSIFEENYRSSNHIKKVSNMPSRWCLTSGRKEKVADGKPGENSPFAETVITYLKKGKAKEVLIQDINRYVEINVANNCNQTPRCGRLIGIGDKGGEFVFYRKTKPKKSRSNGVTQIEYLPPPMLLSKIDEHFLDNFSKVFQISNVNNYEEKKEKIKEVLNNWEQKITKYCKDFENAFNEKKLKLYDNPSYYQDFKSTVFAKKLWTVSAALKSKESDLVRYKTAFAQVQPKILLTAFKTILTKADDYVQNTGSSIDFDALLTVEDLKQDFLEDEEMLLKSIIGRGVRSEILHKKYPSIFPMMTRRSQWGTFFLSGESTEFTIYENGSGKNRGRSRLTNQYNYNYARFNYYNNEIIKRLASYLAEYNLSINNNIRFGYSNEFLTEINSHNKEKRQDLTTWK